MTHEPIELKPRPHEEWKNIFRQRAVELAAEIPEKFGSRVVDEDARRRENLDELRREAGLVASDEEYIERLVETDLQMVRERGLVTDDPTPR